MIAFDPRPFIAALKAIFDTTAAAVVTLPETDLIFMANYRCQPAERLHYPSYELFLRHIGNGLVCPDLPHAEAYYEVYSLLRAEALEQQLKMLGAIEEGKPNWRRYCWLLERRDKQARLKQQQEAKTKPEQPIMQPELAEIPHLEAELNPHEDVPADCMAAIGLGTAEPIAPVANDEPAVAAGPTKPTRLTAQAKRVRNEKARRRFSPWPAPSAPVPAVDDSVEKETNLGKNLSVIGVRYAHYNR